VLWSEYLQGRYVIEDGAAAEDAEAEASVSTTGILQLWCCVTLECMHLPHCIHVTLYTRNTRHCSTSTRARSKQQPCAAPAHTRPNGGMGSGLLLLICVMCTHALLLIVAVAFVSCVHMLCLSSRILKKAQRV
jgi:hypothetical protein